MALPTTTLTNLPVQGPMLDDSGILTQQWRLFFQNLYTRVGGNQAPTNATLSAAVTPAPPGPVVPQTVIFSPYTFTATAKGSLLISDGNIQNVQFSRGGVTFYSIGTFRGSVPVGLGDLVKIIFISAPTVNFVPS